ncbi:BrnA antitoxin family protein [Methylobacterium sp. J-068]|uniref:BrnA antitoxin family protein n=1 Tax=Methylobacterium sp. J-068 TaxID=2836649 RepID=UPI001FB945BA|nr:BrnA antitoxin family protein [Methylobacterium sp. J-068]MCJ2034200.1 BrnA antitoxin family protein [Methylobacterium sp. J-068]
MPGRKTAEPPQDRTDWASLKAVSEDEIERIAAEDTENPATIREDEWAHATVGLPPPKTSIHASFDRDVVDFFKQGGRGYQTRMNAVLRRYMDVQSAKTETKG